MYMYHKNLKNENKTQENIHSFLKPEMNIFGVIKGYASVFNVTDGHRDQVSKGAFQKTLRAWKIMGGAPKMLWQHSQREPIGVWKTLHEDERGLYVEGQLLLNVRQGREAYELIKYGALEGLSIGYRLIKGSVDPIRKIRILKDIDLLEISLVTFPSNSLARVGI